ncbi:hypothetical protein BHE16_03535 [Neomicrococcus aestuarii]|uniref:HTH tetR-type domain-containing protein n=2 Tax=Neomicrococcus aestuarii TaxID=556325 RepID=A0A1L2ZLJ2_9MICC|nr:hypothetical protein BHE16_03535 [Neomicrococcus aestuarii]
MFWFLYAGGMPKVTEEHKADMRLRIQQAAFACVARKGFSSVSMADIIAEAGLSAGAVYLYYKNKEALVVDVGRAVLDIKLAVIGSSSQQTPVPPPSEVIPALFRELLSSGYYPNMAVQVWGEAIHNETLKSLASSIFTELGDYLVNYYRRYLSSERGLDGDTAEARALSIVPATIGMIQGMPLSVALQGRESVDHYISSVQDVLKLMEAR